ncbi:MULTISPECIES: GntR family transcriptional regulator [unclassified Bradyrhizobium]|uniref:GntR family transcriptional regulator n=1 Tax=unclassified Bradyrhizobium TaxID=2631580 RepID=UPI0007C9153A|nr:MULTISPECIES: GntR family transcriptional regulator [unclassified Bradyrhizobium]
MPKIEHRTLNDRAYEEIKKGLISGAFRSGQTLVIRTLAETYGISTTPVREALQRLVAERHLELLPNRSIVVPMLDVDRFVELFRIRRELEGLAGELATPHFRPQHLARLESMVDAMDKTLAGSGGSYQALNQRFHFAIYERASSPLLMTMIQNMWSQVGPFFNELTEDDAFVSKANDQHRAIFSALRAKDSVAVRRHLSLDISVAADHLIPRLKRLQADQPLSMRA